MRFCPLSEPALTAVLLRVAGPANLRHRRVVRDDPICFFEGQAGSLLEDSSFDVSILRMCRAVQDFIQPRLYKSVILIKPSISLSILIRFVHGLGLIQKRRGRVTINDLSVLIEDDDALAVMALKMMSLRLVDYPGIADSLTALWFLFPGACRENDPRFVFVNPSSSPVHVSPASRPKGPTDTSTSATGSPTSSPLTPTSPLNDWSTSTSSSASIASST